MARHTDDDAPWLAEGVAEPARVTLVPRGRLFGGIVIFVLLAALVAVGVYVIVSGKKSNGAGAGVARAEDAPLIAADAGPYKTQPTDRGGLAVEGTGQTVYAAGTGSDPGGTIDTSKTPEEPLARPSAGTPKDLLPPAADAPAATEPAQPPVAPARPAAVVKPAVVKPALPSPAAVGPAPVKPAAAKPVAPVAVVTAPPPPRAEPAKPRPATAGSVQLGAFSTEAKAEAAWTRVSARHPEVAGLAHRIEPLDRGGATLYRLRASGAADAAAVCAALAAVGDACLVAR